MNCVFCQNLDISNNPKNGMKISIVYYETFITNVLYINIYEW
jgi:uncharacterized Fe-S radical SAM superfamily protein PflX